MAVAMAAANAQFSITDEKGTYSQDFNTLGYTPNEGYVTWTNNMSLAGWYASATQYQIVYSKSSERMYSYGMIDNTERALGCVVNSGTSTIIQFGVLLRNDTDREIVGLEVEYTGEQWRDGSTDGLDYLLFHFKTSSDSIALTDASYTEVEELKFTSPINNLGLNGVLDGNLTANQTTLKHRFEVTIPKDHYVMLRWRNDRTLANGHGMGVDDLTVSWTLASSLSSGTMITIR